MPRLRQDKDYIDNTMFRERFQKLEQREGLTLANVAVRAGWENKDREGRMKPDSSRVARLLGMTPDGKRVRDRVSYDNAVLLCNALHIDYTDAGV